MQEMIGVYFSGTGNTRHCVTQLVACLDQDAACFAIEDDHVIESIRNADLIVLGYSVHFSNIPVMVRDFILNHAEIWKGKKVLIIATMGLFSGDGAGCGARILRRCGATVVGGLHLKMPDSIGDEKALKRSLADNQRLIRDADHKIKRATDEIKQGRYPQDGLSVASRIAGLFGQRLWFLRKSARYSDGLKFSDVCIGCGLCAAQCPMKNLQMIDHRPVQTGRCTMCYRCISNCPKQAITLLGNHIVEQCRFDKYN